MRRLLFFFCCCFRCRGEGAGLGELLQGIIRTWVARLFVPVGWFLPCRPSFVMD